MLELEEAEQYKQNGVVKKAASLFGEISSLCQQIENDSPSFNLFLDNLGN